MRFYPSLAYTNIKKNMKLYASYFLSTIFSITLFYTVNSLKYSPSLQNHGTTVTFMAFGSSIIAIFSVIFLLYSNSFVIKNRKKEFGLYSILGMEKKHIMVVLFNEMLIVSIISLMLGIVLGIVLSQLMALIIMNLTHSIIQFTISVSFDAIVATVVIFACIFLVSLLFNFFMIAKSKPIDILKESHAGEKEPKVKILLTLIGIVSLAAGYYLAVTIHDPLKALSLFFVAVVLVMIGTYSLFTAGSIAILKLLKKNKHYYYQPQHFYSVSGMIYRMKQNAVGLANICILCTCILVTISSTFCLYRGIEGTLDRQYPLNVFIQAYDTKQTGHCYEEVDQIVNHIDYNNKISFVSTFITAGYVNGKIVEDNGLVDGGREINYTELSNVNIMGLDSYNKAFKKNETLKQGEILIYAGEKNFENISVFGKDYHVKHMIKDRLIMADQVYAFSNFAIVYPQEEYNQIKDKDSQRESYTVGFNTSKQDSETVLKLMENAKTIDGYSWGSRYAFEEDAYDVYGGLLFIGIFMSIMFLMAAIIIMYNKQLSEGYEDQNKFEILQNVGMSHHEVKRTIRSQVLIVFFLPLVVSIIHLCFAYPLILTVLNAFMMGDAGNYLLATSMSVGALVLIYTIVYLLTTKTYYSIVTK